MKRMKFKLKSAKPQFYPAGQDALGGRFYYRFFLGLLLTVLLTAVILPLSLFAVYAQDLENEGINAGDLLNNEDETGALALETDPVGSVSGGNTNDSETAVLGANPDAEAAPDESSALYDLIGVDGSQPLEVILLITILSVAPSILLMMTSFTRIIIVFGFLRNAMQTPTTPPNQVLTGLALFLTLFIMWPTFMQINEVAYQPYENGEVDAWQAVELAGDPIKDFMLKQTSNENMQFFLNLQGKVIYDTANGAESDGVAGSDGATAWVSEGSVTSDGAVNLADDGITLENYREQLGFELVIPAFMISELSRAFQMGFMLFIPFLIIDIVVGSTLMAMGMMMLPPAMISLPFKIMLFVLVDGWQMLIGSLIQSYN
jgi:flagellar biosynthetic protein FliP